MPDSDIGIPLQSHADPARTTSHGEQALVAQDIAPVLPFENIAAARPALREEKDDSPFYATSGSPKTSGRTASADRPSYDKSPHAGAPDVEQQVEGGPKRELDIEHIEVEDDPRKWPSSRKTRAFLFVCIASLTAGMGANIFFPAIDSLKRELHPPQQIVNLSVSLFILFQGIVPMLWSGISEIYGRKIVYMTSFAIFGLTELGCALANSPGLFLAMRILSACGGSAILTVGGGTLADIYDPQERGMKLGIYYLFPVLGPSVGTLLGGALSLAKPQWRTTFWFMFAYCVLVFAWSIFFQDTFRKERSLAWRAAYARAMKAASLKDRALEHPANQAARLGSGAPGKELSSGTGIVSFPVEPSDSGKKDDHDSDYLPTSAPSNPNQQLGKSGSALAKVVTATGESIPIKVSMRDVNPLAAVGQVLRQPSNFLAVAASGLLFGAQYSLTYTAALSFANPPYSYNSLEVGLVLLSFGGGTIIGSLAGGRYSDRVLARAKTKTGGSLISEFRLRAALAPMPLLPLAFVAYAWTVEKHVPIYGPILSMIGAGISVVWIYSCVLAYIVDSAPGMASTAVSCNSLFRGVTAFVASQVGEPILTAAGNGPLYTGWAILLILAELALVLVCFRGHLWKERTARRKAEKKHLADPVAS